MAFNSQDSISRQIILLSAPIILSQLSRVVMSLADMAMVGHLGADALAATGMGSLVLWIVSSMGIGMRTAVQAVSARRFGERAYSKCTRSLWTGTFLVLCIGLPFSLLGISFCKEISNLFLNDVHVASYCSDYIFIGSFGILFVMQGFVFQGFYVSIKETKIHMMVTIFSNIINIYLNAALIYGSQGIIEFFINLNLPWVAYLWTWSPFPAMEVKGAAIAPVISFIWMVVHYYLYLHKERIKIFIPFDLQISFKDVVQQVKLGFPIGLQEMFTMIAFSIFYRIVGIIGILELATSEIILNIAHASFMPAVGIGMAGATLVGNYLGEKKPDKAEEAIKESIKWSFIFMGTMGTVFIIIPELIISMFTNNLEIIYLGTPCLRIIGILQFFDAIGLTLFFILPAAGNSRFPAVINASICWFLFLPLSYYLGIIMDMGIFGAWIAFAAWIVPFAIIMALKVSTGSWKSIDV